ncbi:MAG: hypothetical protein JWN93_3744 [Hyphomicrobiales bacterium]|nr:hypothetical protein [Hyphomicrobiales bacterium]
MASASSRLSILADGRLLTSHVSLTAIVALLFSISLFGTNLPGSRVAISSGIVLASLLPFVWANAVLAQRFDTTRITRADFAALCFLAYGLSFALLSLLQVLPDDPERPFRQDYWFRHCYHLFLLGPTMAGAAMLSHNTIVRIVRMGARWGLVSYAFIGVADVWTALHYGDPQGLLNEGYLAFLDPSTTTFLCSASYFLYAAAARRLVLPIVVAVTYFVVSTVLDAGMMYNTLTGKYVLLVQLAFTLSIGRSPALALAAGIVATLLVSSLLVAGVVYPGLSRGDLNTAWRFVVWRENLSTMMQTGGVGVGFGTPYYRASANNMISAFRLVSSNEFSHFRYTSAIDVLYVRAQHSTIVNTFYRMGLAGGLLLLWMYIEPVRLAFLRLWRSDLEMRRIVAAAGVIFLIEAIQTALHVGLESPRYFLFFCLSWGFLRAATDRLRAEPLR